MTLDVPAETPALRPLATQALGLLELLIEEIHASIGRIRNGDLSELKDSVRAVRELRHALQVAFDERTRLASFQAEDSRVGRGVLDLGAARAEIGRRLARLRDAGDG